MASFTKIRNRYVRYSPSDRNGTIWVNSSNERIYILPMEGYPKTRCTITQALLNTLSSWDDYTIARSELKWNIRGLPEVFGGESHDGNFYNQVKIPKLDLVPGTLVLTEESLDTVKDLVEMEHLTNQLPQIPLEFNSLLASPLKEEIPEEEECVEGAFVLIKIEQHLPGGN